MQQAIDSASDSGHEICLDGIPNAYIHLSDILHELSIEYINLLPKFKQTNKQGEKLFYNSDRHWNKLGHALASKEIYEFLARKELITK